MSYLIPTHEQAGAGLRAMKSALTIETGTLSPVRRATLQAIQKHLLHTDYDLDALAPIAPEELAAVVRDRTLREQLVNGMVTLTMLDEHVAPREADAVEAYASALEVAPATVRQLRHFVEERWTLLRLDILRNSPGRDGVRRLYEEGGAWNVARNLAAFAGLIENADIAARYHALADFPEGTLGKELWRFYTARSFKFPGEKHGAPEALLPHDLTHILAGYDTDLRSEGLVLAFTAGYQKRNPFGILVFLIVQAQHGMRITPLAETAHGFISSQPAMVEDMVRAFVRGTRASVDFMDHWDFWAVMREPVTALRERYGIEAA